MLMWPVRFCRKKSKFTLEHVVAGAIGNWEAKLELHNKQNTKK